MFPFSLYDETRRSYTDIKTAMTDHPEGEILKSDRLAYLEKRDKVLGELEAWARQYQIVCATYANESPEGEPNHFFQAGKAFSLTLLQDKIKELEL